jgi:hypothetical protein
MDFLSMPKKYYAKEKNPLHLAGYTVAIGMMGVGVLETIEGIYYFVRQGSSNMILGPLGVVAGGYMAYLYLREANLVGGY